MSGKDIACFSGAAQYSSLAWSPSYNYTSLSPSFASNVQAWRPSLSPSFASNVQAWRPSLLPSFANNVQVAWRPRQVELSYTSTTLNQRKPMVTGLTSPRLANKSLVSRKRKSDDNNDDDCADGNNTDYDEEDCDDESKPQVTRSMEKEWNNKILVMFFALVIVIYCIYLVAPNSWT